MVFRFFTLVIISLSAACFPYTLRAQHDVDFEEYKINHGNDTTYQTSNAFSDAAKTYLNEQLRYGKLSKAIEKAGIKGKYNFDITLQNNGEVLTVYAHTDENTNISNQNLLKTLVKKVKFDLKIPENIRVKFNYTFNIY